MDGKPPFKKNERWEIRQTAQYRFYGGSVDDEAIRPLFIKWQFFFSLFDRVINHKNADYTSPPFNTDWVSQPYKTMQVLDYMRELWVEKLEKEHEADQAKIRR